MTTADGVDLLRCERIVNESWSKAGVYFDEIKKIMEKGENEKNNKREREIIKIFARIAYQKIILDKATDKQCDIYFPEK